jgi:cytochrome c peroxidase
MRTTVLGLVLAAAFAGVMGVTAGEATPLGLPPIPIPADNPQTPEKITLGEQLFNDKRFSSTGEVACSNCHLPAKAFTDSPLKVSEGIEKLTGHGTRRRWSTPSTSGRSSGTVARPRSRIRRSIRS